MKPPRVEEKIVPLVSDEQIADLLSLVNPSLARTPQDTFRLRRTMPWCLSSSIRRDA